MRVPCLLGCAVALVAGSVAFTEGTALAAEAVQPVAFDGFLGDFLKSCHPSDAYDTLTRELVVKSASGNWKLSGKIKIAEDLRPHIGKPQLRPGPKDNGEPSATLVVPIIAGTFLGLKIKAITVDFTDNGDDVVIFDETADKVQSALKSEVEKASKNLDDPVLSIKLTTKDHSPALDCGHYS